MKMNERYFMTAMNLPELIKLYRERKGFSIVQLATFSGLHRNYIAKIEKGEANPTLTTIECLFTALDLDFSLCIVGNE